MTGNKALVMRSVLLALRVCFAPVCAHLLFGQLLQCGIDRNE